MKIFVYSVREDEEKYVEFATYEGIRHSWCSFESGEASDVVIRELE